MVVLDLFNARNFKTPPQTHIKCFADFVPHQTSQARGNLGGHHEVNMLFDSHLISRKIAMTRLAAGRPSWEEGSVVVAVLC